MSAPVITVGANVRTWTEFRVIDATPAEIETLSQADTPEAYELAAALFDADRLEWVGVNQESAWTPFEEHREPSVIDLEPETEDAA